MGIPRGGVFSCHPWNSPLPLRLELPQEHPELQFLARRALPALLPRCSQDFSPPKSLGGLWRPRPEDLPLLCSGNREPLLGLREDLGTDVRVLPGCQGAAAPGI